MEFSTVEMDLSDEVTSSKTIKNSRYSDIPVDPKGLSIGNSEGNGSVTVSTRQASLFERLDLNIASIVIGALFFMIVITWVDTLRAFCNGAINDTDDDRYYLLTRKIWAAVLITLTSIFLSILFFTWYKHHTKFVI